MDVTVTKNYCIMVKGLLFYINMYLFDKIRNHELMGSGSVLARKSILAP